METIKLNPKRMSVQIQRLLIMMVAIIVASMTITACLEDENSDENNEENGGNGGGGVAGKRLKSSLTTCSAPGFVNSRSELTYNSDGTVKRSDTYDASSSKLLNYFINTNNPDGTFGKVVMYESDNTKVMEDTYYYNSNKTIQKFLSAYFQNGVKVQTVIHEFTYDNRRKISQKYYQEGQSAYGELTYNYDASGRRTTTDLKYYSFDPNMVLSMTYTRTYNSDGTLQKVTYPYSFVDDTPITVTFTWENGKTTYDFDMYNPW